MKKFGCFVHSLQTYYNRVGQIKQYVKDNRKDRGRFSVFSLDTMSTWGTSPSTHPTFSVVSNRPGNLDMKNL